VIDTATGCDYEVCKEVVLRVVSSSYINKSARLSELFLYLCKRVLDETVDDIHELEVGHKVFGRPEYYDTGADNIVRVHASLLRKRLNEYFLTEGRDEPLIIEIPRGNYAPTFLKRPPPAIAVPISNGLLQSPQLSGPMFTLPMPASVPPARHVQRGWMFWLPTAFAVLFASLSVILLVGSQRTKQSELSATIFARATAAEQFWSQLFHEGKSTEIVLDDASLDLYQEATGHPITLAEYFDRSYLQTVDPAVAAAKLNPKLVSSSLIRRQSSYADASLIWRLAQTAGALRGNADIQFARDFSFRQVKSGNVILLGSRESNPWIQLFENSLTLRWKFDPALDTYYPIDTTAPETQQDMFRVGPETGGAHDGYATVSFLPNLGGNGNVLIISGTGGTAVGGAVDLLSNVLMMDQLRARLQKTSTSSFPYFEILLKVERGTSLPRHMTIVICRSPSRLTNN
jgi:hypothetical protein